MNKIGDSYSESRIITDQYIMKTVSWSGDNNPIHTNEEYACKSVFGRKIAHGIIALGLVSKIVGNNCPGEGSILISQTVNYVAPVFVNDTITATVTIQEKIDGKDIYDIKYNVINQDGKVVVEGKMKVKHREIN